MVKHKTLIWKVSILGMIALFLTGCTALAKPTSQTPGTVIGTVMYKSLTGGGDIKPLPNVMIALCQLPVKNLSDGPAVAESNGREAEHICELLETPTTLTNTDGSFTLDNVPPASYLVLFHLYPDELDSQGGHWSGVDLSEAHLNAIDMEVFSSDQPDFWEEGGPVIGLASWSAAKGMIVTSGNVCSNKYGLCFSIQEERAYPVINVVSNESIEIQLTTHFLPEE